MNYASRITQYEFDISYCVTRKETTHEPTHSLLF